VRADAIRARLRQADDVSPAVRASLPDWLDTLLAEQLGEAWPAVRATLNKPAEVFLRVNTLKTERRSLKTRLAQDGFITEAVDEVPTALRMAQRYNVFGLPAFQEGLFEVQDASSQRIAPFLQVEPGQKVVDACAGAGGKSLHLAALMQNKGKIIALDIHEWKLKELRKRAARAGVDVIETRPIDSTKTFKRLAGYADRLLLDVPCSGLGVLRRNPDAKWKLQPAEIERLTALQQDLLSRYSAMVKPGGKLVYATCSVLPAENERQVQTFLAARGGEWTLEEELFLNPAETGHDGFYAARLARKPAEKPTEKPAEVAAEAPAVDASAEEA
jgi:16S rRNA (cytosine967-C5)-methyltransferase